MTESSTTTWFDPRLTVFIIWGIFVFLFICIPSKRVVQKLFHFMGCDICGYDADREEESGGSGGVSENRDGTIYEVLSTARKQEIDSLRASHITYRLHPFSLTLEKKNMLRRISDTQPSSLETHSGKTKFESEEDNNNNSNTPPQDKPPSFNDLNNNEGDIDVETGIVLRRSVDPPSSEDEEENKQEEEKEGESADYTHVLVPQPGYNVDGENVVIPTIPDEEAENKLLKNNNKERKARIRFFGGGGGGGGKEKEKDESALKEIEIKEDPTTNTDDNEEKGEKNRPCSIFCAICLGEYEPSERVSWSSNPSCTHVFHEDCVTNWLVSLGRTKSKQQRFAPEPTVAQLFNYELECPCCRQEFLCRKMAELPEVHNAMDRV